MCLCLYYYIIIDNKYKKITINNYSNVSYLINFSYLNNNDFKI